MELFDSHAHYNDEKFDKDRKELLLDIYNSGITKIINAGYSLESSKKALEIANNYDFIYVTAGISPNDIDDFKDEYLLEVEELLSLLLMQFLTTHQIPFLLNGQVILLKVVDW